MRMAQRVRIGCIVCMIVVSCALLPTISAQAVTDTNCDPNDGGETVCTGVDPNAECPVGGTKCKCKSGYQQDKTSSNACAKVLGEQCPTNVDCTGVENSECSEATCSCVTDYQEVNDLCEKAVTDTDCNPTVDGATVCKAVDPNAECPTGGQKCKCKSGYEQDKIIVNTCAKVLGGQCPANVDCTVANSECSSSKCSCEVGYKEANNICVKAVSETDCDPANNDGTTGESAVCKAVDVNAECPAGTTKCACKDGYKEGNPDSHTCVLKAAESSATSVCVTTSFIVTSMLIYLTRFILW